jgi:hypothetical protein
MTKEAQQHLDELLLEFKYDFSEKYRKGQEEHGGLLSERPTLPDLRHEVLDLVAYTYTLQQQLRMYAALLRMVNRLISEGKMAEAQDSIDHVIFELECQTKRK